VAQATGLRCVHARRFYHEAEILKVALAACARVRAKFFADTHLVRDCAKTLATPSTSETVRRLPESHPREWVDGSSPAYKQRRLDRFFESHPREWVVFGDAGERPPSVGWT
jgi:hypothetical protein